MSKINAGWDHFFCNKDWPWLWYELVHSNPCFFQKWISPIHFKVLASQSWTTFITSGHNSWTLSKVELTSLTANALNPFYKITSASHVAARPLQSSAEGRVMAFGRGTPIFVHARYKKQGSDHLICWLKEGMSLFWNTCWRNRCIQPV